MVTFSNEMPIFTLLTDEQPPQAFPIPLAVAQQCNYIDSQIKSPMKKNQFQCIIPDSETNDILHLISCLSSISTIKATQSKITQRKIIEKSLAQYINTLNKIELVNLTHNADFLNFSDETFYKYLVNSLTQKIIATPAAERDCFNSLSHMNLFKSVMKKIVKKTKIDALLLQAYSDTLTETFPPATENLSAWLWKKIGNIFSLQNRFDNIYYLNNQTGTVITGSMIGREYASKCTQLTIIKNKQPIFTHDLTNTEKILHISANDDETLFICSIRKSESYTKNFVINLLNSNKPIIDSFGHCVFTQDNKKLYITRGKDFGILNIENDDFTAINVGNAKPIFGISCNKLGTIVINTKNEIFISDKQVNGLPVFKQLNCDTIQKKCQKHFTLIYNAYLLPTKKNKICLSVMHHADQNKNNQSSYIVDCSSLKTVILPEPFSHLKLDAHEIACISDDILFFCCSGFYANGYSFNLKTGSFLSKKKNCKRTQRLAFTADNKNSINEIYTDSNGSKQRKIRIKPLIDDTMLSTIDCLNKGNIPLIVLNIAQNDDTLITLDPENYNDYNNLPDSIKEVIAASKIITEDTLQSRLKGIAYSMYKMMLHPLKIAFICSGSIAIALIFTMTLNKTGDPRTSETFISVIGLALGFIG